MGGLASRLSSFTLGKLYNPLVQVRVGFKALGERDCGQACNPSSWDRRQEDQECMPASYPAVGTVVTI